MASTTAATLRDLYAREASKIRRAFQRSGDGVAVVHARASLVDNIAVALWQEFMSGGLLGPKGFALAARGGYGRGTLFPHSDLDILFLFADERTQRSFERQAGLFCQYLWDLDLRVAPTARTLSQAARFDAQNLELVPSLLDCRYIAGDEQLFYTLRAETLPRLVRAEWQGIVGQLTELTQARRRKHGDTIFHLEPNVKESAGGLRDYDVGNWLHTLARLRDHGAWPDADDDRSLAVRSECDEAMAFLTSVRCFLHFRHKRNDNTLSWDAQDEAALHSVGMDKRIHPTTTEWMRAYYRHARQILRWTSDLLEEAPAERSSLYRNFLRWRSRVSNADFSVVDGRVYFQESSSAADPDMLLRAFEFLARHGFRFARDTERRISQALPSLAPRMPAGPEIWPRLRDVLLAPYAAQALREMHVLGFFKLVVPEFDAVDALVLRDYYHRYTVDEHTFVALEAVHQLAKRESEWQSRFAEIFSTVVEPELLLLSILLHDLGKSGGDMPHTTASAIVADAVTARFGMSEAQRDTLRFLVANHLEMSAALRRDIFDSDTVEAFARKVGSPELLKMLCLLTYADIRAVSPEALTPWKAENLWHLYAATVNQMDRRADQLPQRGEELSLATARATHPAAPTFNEFLRGLPRRYVRTHSTEQVAAHFAMANRLAENPVQVALGTRRDLYELTVITRDRPCLFASLCGALTAWGMDIFKASAYSNHAGVVVDTLVFRDPFNNLRLNPPERERFQQIVARAVSGDVNLEAQIEGRIHSGKIVPVKKTIEPSVSFNNESSSHSTIVEVIAQDRVGLLFRMAAAFAHLGCNIDIALIDTEGPMAVDVFYVTRNGHKLDDDGLQSVKQALLDNVRCVSGAHT